MTQKSNIEQITTESDNTPYGDWSLESCPDYDDPEYFFWCQEKAAADVRKS